MHRQHVTVFLAWRPALLDDATIARSLATLSDDEHARMGRYRDAADARAFAWSRGLQRTLLAAHLGADPASLVFVQDGDRKPRLADGRCEYNASHSGALFGLAISDRPVGLDLELARETPNLLRVAGRVLPPAIAAGIASAPESERQARFFTAWTQLEAHAKLHGEGVWRLLAERERHAEAEGIRLTSLALPTPYFGAVAVARADPTVTTRWHD